MAKGKLSGKSGTVSDEAEASLQGEAASRMSAAALELEKARRLAHSASAPAEDESEPAPEAPSRLDTILETIADQGKFEVYRQVGGGNKSKVGIYPINEWPERMETIASTYKGGTFTIIFKDAHGRIRGQETQTFDAVAYSAGSAPSQERGSDVVDRILERMESRDESNRRDMAALQAENSKMMLEMVKLVAQRPAAEAAQAPSFPEMLKLIKDLTPAPVDPLASLKGTMEMIVMLKDGAAVTEPQSPWVVALEKGIDLLTPIISVLAQKAGSSGRVSARPGGLSPVAPADVRRLPPAAGEDLKVVPAKAPALNPPAPEAAAPEPMVIDPGMKEYASRLLGAAAGQVRPSIVAQLVVDAVTPESVEEFEAMIENEKILDILLAAEPRLSAHRLWLEQVLNETQEKFDEAYPPETEGPGTVDAAPAPAMAPAPIPAPAPATPAPIPAPVDAAPVPETVPLETSHA